MHSAHEPKFPAIDSGEYRHVMGHFLTGVTIITAIDPETNNPVGLAASSFTSVSMDPALVLFCAGKSSSSWAKIQAAGNYCVNILAASDEALCRTFASKSADKFEGVGWERGPSGSPILDASLAWIDCSMHEEVDAGDHIVAIGRVLALGARDTTGPLAYYRGGYGRFES
jgi:3-hydroxy-9,10-secoandrosta-1,3,5(10)-triene-9,17-dione monooxygenase reductase component